MRASRPLSMWQSDPERVGFPLPVDATCHQDRSIGGRTFMCGAPAPGRVTVERHDEPLYAWWSGRSAPASRAEDEPMTSRQFARLRRLTQHAALTLAAARADLAAPEAPALLDGADTLLHSLARELAALEADALPPIRRLAPPHYEPGPGPRRGMAEAAGTAQGGA